MSIEIVRITAICIFACVAVASMAACEADQGRGRTSVAIAKLKCEAPNE